MTLMSGVSSGDNAKGILYKRNVRDGKRHYLSGQFRGIGEESVRVSCEVSVALNICCVDHCANFLQLFLGQLQFSGRYVALQVSHLRRAVK